MSQVVGVPLQLKSVSQLALTTEGEEGRGRREGVLGVAAGPG